MTCPALLQVLMKNTGSCAWYSVNGHNHPQWQSRCPTASTSPKLSAPPPPPSLAVLPPPQAGTCRFWKVSIWHADLPSLSSWVRRNSLTMLRVISLFCDAILPAQQLPPLPPPPLSAMPLLNPENGKAWRFLVWHAVLPLLSPWMRLSS
jgi:hypothetical protein